MKLTLLFRNKVKETYTTLNLTHRNEKRLNNSTVEQSNNSLRIQCDWVYIQFHLQKISYHSSSLLRIPWHEMSIPLHFSWLLQHPKNPYGSKRMHWRRKTKSSCRKKRETFIKRTWSASVTQIWANLDVHHQINVSVYVAHKELVNINVLNGIVSKLIRL